MPRKSKLEIYLEERDKRIREYLYKTYFWKNEDEYQEIKDAYEHITYCLSGNFNCHRDKINFLKQFER